MKTLLTLAMLLMAAPAVAQNIPEADAVSVGAATALSADDLKAGVNVATADGRRLGKIDRVRMADGQPVSVSIFFAGRFVNVPVSSLSKGEKGLVTSLGRSDLVKL